MIQAPDRTKSRRERYWPSASLRTYLAAVILLAIFPIAVLMCVRTFVDVRDEQAQIEQSLTRSAQAFSHTVQSELRASFDALDLLAQTELLRRGDLSQLDQRLQLQRGLRRDWDSVFLMDRDGNLLLDTAAPSNIPVPAEIPALRQSVFARRQPAVSGLVGEPPGHVVLAVPVLLEGAPRYVLGARVGAAAWQRLADGAIRPSGAVATILGPKLRPVSAIRGREAGEAAAAYLAGQAVGSTGWSVQVALPAGPIDASHRQAILGALSTTAASLLAGVLLAALTARQLTRRLESAQDAGCSVVSHQFLTMLGHELRNPLGAISAAADVLENAGADGDSAREARAIIARQTRNLSQMMNDLVDAGRVIAGEIVLSHQPVDVAAVAMRVQQTFMLTGAAANHSLHCDLQPAWIDGDPVRIEQIVSTLLTDALKSTPAPGRVDVVVRRNGQTVVLEVRASGEGARADLFVQGEQTLDRRAGGLGIGLTLVRRLVELHGGTIGLESSAHASSFTVRLQAIEPARAPADEALPLTHPREVLVVADNEDVAASLRSQLELDGHSVSTAVDGVDGLARLLQRRPEVSIVAIGLPGITGLELARHARAAGYAGRMIALSGDGPERNMAKALAAGFDACLVKPVDRLELRASLRAD